MESVVGRGRPFSGPWRAATWNANAYFRATGVRHKRSYLGGLLKHFDFVALQETHSVESVLAAETHRFDEYHSAWINGPAKNVGGAALFLRKQFVSVIRAEPIGPDGNLDIFARIELTCAVFEKKQARKLVLIDVLDVHSLYRLSSL